MKSFLRFLMRNRLYSLINLAGLTLSLALVTIIFSYAGAQRRTARTVPDYENAYAVTWKGDGLLCYGVSDRLSGLPEAEAMTRRLRLRVRGKDIPVRHNVRGCRLFRFLRHRVPQRLS